MTFKEKLKAIELKQEMVSKAGNRCFYCGTLLSIDKLQLAHIVPKYGNFVKKYGKEAIHHPLNMRVTCSSCNSLAMDECSKSDYAREIHFKPIYKELGIEL